MTNKWSRGSCCSLSTSELWELRGYRPDQGESLRDSGVTTFGPLHGLPWPRAGVFRLKGKEARQVQVKWTLTYISGQNLSHMINMSLHRANPKAKAMRRSHDRMEKPSLHAIPQEHPQAQESGP